MKAFLITVVAVVLGVFLATFIAKQLNKPKPATTA